MGILEQWLPNALGGVEPTDVEGTSCFIWNTPAQASRCVSSLTSGAENAWDLLGQYRAGSVV